MLAKLYSAILQGTALAPVLCQSMLWWTVKQKKACFIKDKEGIRGVSKCVCKQQKWELLACSIYFVVELPKETYHGKAV